MPDVRSRAVPPELLRAFPPSANALLDLARAPGRRHAGGDRGGGLRKPGRRAPGGAAPDPRHRRRPSTDLQVIARVVPATEPNPQRSRRAVYRIVDPYVAFWHRVIAPLVNAGSIGLVPPERLWDEIVAPRLDDYMGPVFEEVCRDFVRRGDRLPFKPMRVGEWWDASSRNQVDVVATGARSELLVGECKWGRVTAGHLTALRSRAQMVAAELGDVQQVHTALFTGRGDADDAVRREAEAGETFLFSAEDLR